jgi:glycogen debranching enzyme
MYLTQDLDKKCYLLAGKKAFFHRFCDTGFKTKWTGLWAGNKKFLDYFAFKVNEQWLSPENCKKFEEDGATATHSFELEGLKVEENVFVPDDMPALVCKLTFSNKSQKETRVEINLEVGVNIRRMEENWNMREYAKKFEENKIFVSNELGVLAFGASIVGKNVLTSYYKEHSPGELQRCFVPGIYNTTFNLSPLSTQSVLFTFLCGEKENDVKAVFNKASSYDEILARKYEVYKMNEDSLETEDPVLKSLFQTAAINLEKCAHDAGVKGFLAGYPWFTQLWGRDLGWVVRAAVNLGNFEFAKSSLEVLAENQSENGLIPNFITLDGKCDYNSADATPLWIIALNKYVECSGDLNFLERMKESLLKALNWYRKNSDENGLVSNGSRQTWMDTLDRKGICLEVCSFWYEALKSASNLLSLLGDSVGSKALLDSSKLLRNSIEKYFWKEDFYVDNLETGERSINAVFPLIFGISKRPAKALKVLESDEFTTEFGIRTLSKYSSSYNPAGYHTGSSWGITTALMACAEFLNNRTEKGMEYLQKISNTLNKFCLNSLPEAWNSEDGSLNLLKPFGYEYAAFLQAWSAAGVIICIDEFLLGLKEDAINKSITISPAIREERVKRRKLIDKDLIELIVEEAGRRISSTCKSSKERFYKLITLPKV